MPYISKAKAREVIEELINCGLSIEEFADMVTGWLTGQDAIDMLRANDYLPEWMLEKEEEEEEEAPTATYADSPSDRVREPIDLEDDVDPQGA